MYGEQNCWYERKDMKLRRQEKGGMHQAVALSNKYRERNGGSAALCRAEIINAVALIGEQAPSSTISGLKLSAGLSGLAC
jgi:hypothetical protein